MPLMVITSAAQVAETPAGKPFAPGTPSLAIPVALVVVWVIPAGRVVEIQRVVDVPAVAVLSGVTVIVPIALTLPQPPVNGML